MFPHLHVTRRANDSSCVVQQVETDPRFGLDSLTVSSDWSWDKCCWSCCYGWSSEGPPATSTHAACTTAERKKMKSMILLKSKCRERRLQIRWATFVSGKRGNKKNGTFANNFNWVALRRLKHDFSICPPLLKVWTASRYFLKGRKTIFALKLSEVPRPLNHFSNLPLLKFNLMMWQDMQCCTVREISKKVMLLICKKTKDICKICTKYVSDYTAHIYNS